MLNEVGPGASVSLVHGDGCIPGSCGGCGLMEPISIKGKNELLRITYTQHMTAITMISYSGYYSTIIIKMLILCPKTTVNIVVLSSETKFAVYLKNESKSWQW